MVGDNDAGGVSTYAQRDRLGHQPALDLVLLIPVLIVNQEMVVRLGAVTGVGHGRLIFERFGRFWGWFAVGDLSSSLPDDRDRVHRYLAGRCVLRCGLRTSRYRWPGILLTVSRSRVVSRPGRADVRDPLRQPADRPARILSHPNIGTGLRTASSFRACRAGDIHGGAADHRDRRHDRRTVAAVLPAANVVDSGINTALDPV